MTADERLRLIRIKIKRADKHFDELESAIGNLGKTSFNSISVQFDPQTEKPGLQAKPLYIYGTDIPAIAGDVVHNLRCALDHLAYHLVMVGVAFGEVPPEKWDDIQFPISYSFEGYKSSKQRRIQGARREAIEAIDALKPYKDGNPALWLLRKLDNTDKHSFILAAGEDTIMGGVALKTYRPYFSGFVVPKDDQGVNLSSEEPRFEPSISGANAMLPTLHQLSHLVRNIVDRFAPLLDDSQPVVEAISPPNEFREVFDED